MHVLEWAPAPPCVAPPKVSRCDIPTCARESSSCETRASRFASAVRSLETSCCRLWTSSSTCDQRSCCVISVTPQVIDCTLSAWKIYQQEQQQSRPAKDMSLSSRRQPVSSKFCGPTFRPCPESAIWTHDQISHQKLVEQRIFGNDELLVGRSQVPYLLLQCWAVSSTSQT